MIYHGYTWLREDWIILTFSYKLQNCQSWPLFRETKATIIFGKRGGGVGEKSMNQNVLDVQVCIL